MMISRGCPYRLAEALRASVCVLLDESIDKDAIHLVRDQDRRISRVAVDGEVEIEVSESDITSRPKLEGVQSSPSGRPYTRPASGPTNRRYMTTAAPKLRQSPYSTPIHGLGGAGRSQLLAVKCSRSRQGLS
jgi:hypothetical protein